MKKLTILALVAVTAAANAQTFTNSASLQMPAIGTGGSSSTDGNSTVRSFIVVSGVAGPILSMRVRLFGLAGTFPDDLDIMLVAPSGSRTILMSDVGGATALPFLGVDLTFDDSASASLPDSSSLQSGTYKPTNFGSGDTWFGPGGTPETPATSASLSTFTNQNANGTWTLWARDDAIGDIHVLNQGWQVEFTAVPEPGTMAALGLGVAALLRRRKKA